MVDVTLESIDNVIVQQYSIYKKEQVFVFLIHCNINQFQHHSTEFNQFSQFKIKIYSWTLPDLFSTEEMTGQTYNSRQWKVKEFKDFESLELSEPRPVDTSKLGPNDVLVKFKAVSLNYRDLSILKGLYGLREYYPITLISNQLENEKC